MKKAKTKSGKFRKFLSGVFYTIGDAFDSAKVSPRRGTPPGAYPTDAKNELPSYTRNELVRRARYLEKNSGHIRGTLRDMKVYGIGDGIRPNAKSVNSEWNRSAEEYFKMWSRKCDITNRFSFREVQALVSRAIDVDGEVFVIKNYDAHKQPKLQVVETHRLVSESSEEGVCGGIKFGKFGEPLFYYFKGDDEFASPQKVPASAVLHIFEPERVSYVRAFPSIWGLCEVLTYGELLSMFNAIKPRKIKNEILDGFDLDEKVAASFFNSLRIVRNICAHHGRLWNKRLFSNFIAPMRPESLSLSLNYPTISDTDSDEIKSRKLDTQKSIYNIIVMLIYFVGKIAPQSKWLERLVALINNDSNKQYLREMGFPKDWKNRPIWKDL